MDKEKDVLKKVGPPTIHRGINLPSKMPPTTASMSAREIEEILNNIPSFEIPVGTSKIYLDTGLEAAMHKLKIGENESHNEDCRLEKLAYVGKTLKHVEENAVKKLVWV